MNQRNRSITRQLVTFGFLVLLGLNTTQALAQQETLASKLPPALREQGQALLDEKNNQRRATLANDLARKDAAGTLDFFLALLDRDPAPAVRNVILTVLARTRN